MRAEVLRARGLTAGTRAQIYASRETGGLGHDHAYQGAAAALADQIERIVQTEVGTPASIALRAHIRATYMRLGWAEREEMMEWYPKHLEGVLSEEMIVEAWLLSRLRAGVRMRAVGAMAGSEPIRLVSEDGQDRGPPIWEADRRQEWQRGGEGPCRARVGRGEKGGVVLRLWVVEATQGGGGGTLTDAWVGLATLTDAYS